MKKKIKVLILILSILTTGSLGITFGLFFYFNTPSARSALGMVYDDDINKIVLFGGGNQEGSSYNSYGDTWLYDPIANIWSEISPQNSPSARSSHALVYDSVNKKIIMFGGIDSNYNWLNETWIYSSQSESWNQVFPDNSPSPRGSVSLYFDVQAQKVILYGGYREVGGHLDETWSYDYASNNWTNLNPSIKPVGRYGASMVYDPIKERGLLFGGNTGEIIGITDETWVYYYSNNSWSELTPVSNPSHRYWAGLTYDESAQKIILFGGRGSGGVGGALDDTWIYDSSTNIWSDASPSTNPSNRFHFPLVYAPEVEKSILMGGFRFDDINFGDTWTYSHSSNNWNKVK